MQVGIVFEPRQIERAIFVSLFGMCLLLFGYHTFQSSDNIYVATYKMQETYYKQWLIDKSRFGNIIEMKELVHMFERYNVQVPNYVDQIVLAPGTSIRDGTAVFFAVPKSNKYGIAVPPVIKLVCPQNNTEYSVGDPVPFKLEILDQQSQILKIEVYINGESAGQLQCTPELATGSWRPTEEDQNTISFVAYNEFGLTTTLTSSNIFTHINYPPTVQIPDMDDNYNIKSGTAYKIVVNAVDPNREDMVMNVTLLIDGKPLASIRKPPYGFVVGPLDPGIYTLHALATDNHGATGETPIFKLYVNQN